MFDQFPQGSIRMYEVLSRFFRGSIAFSDGSIQLLYKVLRFERLQKSRTRF